MKQVENSVYGPVRVSRFPVSQFFLFFGGGLLASGIHMGLLTLMHEVDAADVIQGTVPILYWAAVSLGLTLLTRRCMRETFEKPVQELAAATRKVAEGQQ